MTTCTGCGHNDPDELQPGPSGDPYCHDCRTTFAEASPHNY